VEEKVDGSQFSFGVFEGELRVRSKGKQMEPDSPEKMFLPAIATARELAPILKDGWTYRGEFLGKPKHNVLAYDRNPDRYVILFDINTGEEQYLGPEEKAAEAERIGLEVVPVLHNGVVSDAEALLAFLDRVSVLGGQKVEGFVAKNYARFGPDKKALMGKHVCESFKEIHAGEFRKANPTQGDIVQRLIMRHRTPARWNKAIQHLKERGDLENSPRDIGKLLNEIKSDVEKECFEDIRAELWKHFWPQVERAIVAGFPQFYKDTLLRSQFTEPTA
jgi:hypothetical protein